MNDRMVNTAIHVIRLLLNGNLSTNNLIRQTSSDKSHVENVLKTLKKSKIITRNPSPKHKQMKINKLDSLGRDFSEILIKVKQYEDAFNKFIQLYKKKEVWDESDKDEIYNVIEVCTSNICNILMRMYISVANQEIHPVALKILDKIIFNSITDQFSIILKSGKDNNVNMVHYHFILIILESLSKHKVGVDLFSNPYVGGAAKNLLGSLFQLMIFPSNEKRLSEYVQKYYSPIIGQSDASQMKVILTDYDRVMSSSA